VSTLDSRDANRFYALVKEVKDTWDVEFTVQSYSGRAMYGARCIGISCQDSPAFPFQFGMRLLDAHLNTTFPSDDVEAQGGLDYEVAVELLNEVFRDARSDDMGLGTVYYFPRVTWDEEWDDDDGET
jgi:hypothetical protein